MASSRDLVTLFVGLELVTGPTFLMAGWRKGDPRSNEAALKFFIIGVLSAALMLFGMTLVYGFTGQLTFAGIRQATEGIASSPLLTVGVILTLLGFAFKVSAVPFHYWTPDTYQGAPIPVTAYLSVVSKTAGFVGLLAMCYLAFVHLRDIWGPMLWILAAVSMTAGNLIALRQDDIVRLLGYSSIAQGGFILVPFGAAVAADVSLDQLQTAFFATVTYLVIYAVMNLGAFAVVIAGANRLKSTAIADWAGLGTYAPGLAALLALFFASLAGIPPLAGWFAKLVMFTSVMGVDSGWAIDAGRDRRGQLGGGVLLLRQGDQGGLVRPGADPHPRRRVPPGGYLGGAPAAVRPRPDRGGCRAHRVLSPGGRRHRGAGEHHRRRSLIGRMPGTLVMSAPLVAALSARIAATGPIPFDEFMRVLPVRRRARLLRHRPAAVGGRRRLPHLARGEPLVREDRRPVRGRRGR